MMSWCKVILSVETRVAINQTKQPICHIVRGNKILIILITRLCFLAVELTNWSEHKSTALVLKSI